MVAESTLSKKVLTRENRLPVTDPSYRYPSSINPYWEKLQSLPAGVICDQETEELQGLWRKKFSETYQRHALTQKKLILEVGCNGGHLLTALAEREPDALYLGIDWKFKQIYRAAEKAKKKDLQNTLFLRSRAERVPFTFGEHELDEVKVYFPDPWEKRAVKKNRFITSSWLQNIWKILKPSGNLHIKTDHREYFTWILEEIEKSKGPWIWEEKTFHLHKNCVDPEKLEIPDVTLFEKLFIKDGIEINSLKLRPKYIDTHLKR